MSELGTKNYWDKSYSTEIKNYQSHGDVGDVWFDESSELRVIKYMKEACQQNEITLQDKILDLGTGNGNMLVSLHFEGFTDLIGVDYSENGIQLASNIAKDQGLNNIIYKVSDLLCDESIMELGIGKFKICLDKGTYDAVSLMEDPEKNKRTYITNVSKLMEETGIFILTSCNFTAEELTEDFKGILKLKAIIPTQIFKFGGKTGSVVTSIVFEKIS